MAKSLFVGNLAYGAMEREVKDLFSQFGEVESVRFIMDWRKGRFRGFGFVTMPDADAVRAVHRLDGKEFQGRKLRVNEAKPKSLAS